MAEYCSIYMHILIRIERAVACDKFTAITNTTIYVTCNHIHASLKDKHHTVCKLVLQSKSKHTYTVISTESAKHGQYVVDTEYIILSSSSKLARKAKCNINSYNKSV